jgi:hypothetical protein
MNEYFPSQPENPFEPDTSPEGLDTSPEQLVSAYVNNPDSLSDQEKQAALNAAKEQASLDGMRGTIILESGDEKYWGKEYNNVFVFDGTLRGNYEDFPSDPTRRTGDQQVSGAGGEDTHVMIETDDGHMIVIRRTNDEKSASEQTFDLSSTSFYEGTAGETAFKTMRVDTTQLKDTVVMVGEPLTLPKAAGSKKFKSNGKVVKVTTFMRTDEGKVAEGHPYLNDASKQRNTVEEFYRAAELARKVAGDIGPLALARVAIKEELKINDGAEIARDFGMTRQDMIRNLGDTIEKTNAFTERVKSLADAEGRDMTDKERRQIEYMKEVITFQREVIKKMAEEEVAA